MGMYLHALVFSLALYLHSELRCASENRPALWSSYTDKITAVCVHPRLGQEIVLLFRVIINCTNLQRHYLNCLPQGLERPTVNNVKTPCGWINSTENRNSHSQWTITVHHTFLLLLTFKELKLPMPFGRCDKLQSMEILVLAYHEKNYSHIIPSPSIHYCGKRSPFTLIWKNSSMVLNYLHLPLVSVLPNGGIVVTEHRTGQFILHYQVCEKMLEKVITQLITHSTWTNRTAEFILTIGLHFSRSLARQKYSVHLLGQRLRVLDLGFTYDTISNRHLAIEVFEGPRPSEIYRHSYQDYLLSNEMIYFVGFQGVVEVVCFQHQCSGIHLIYIWSLAIDFAGFRRVNQGILIEHPSPFCKTKWSQLVYCAYTIVGHNYNNIRISFDDISFRGPDYLGELSEEHQCTLAGVAVADGLRFMILRDIGDSLPFVTDGNTSREFVVDAIFPEVTSCYKTLQRAEGRRGKLSKAFPIDHFVSTSQTLSLVVYAYEAYLEEFSLRLTITASRCVGAMIGCYQIPSNAFAQIADKQQHAWESRDAIKSTLCQFGNFLLVDVPSNVMGVPVLMQFAFCTYTDDQVTAVLLLSTLHADECIEVQLNPHFHLAESLWCKLTRSNLDQFIKIHAEQYQRFFLVASSCIASLYEELDQSSYFHYQHDKMLRHHSNSSYFRSKCFKITTKLTMLCHSIEKVHGQLSITRIRHDLQRKLDKPLCRQSNTFLQNTTTTLMYLKPYDILRITDQFTQDGNQFDPVFNFFLGWYLGLFELKLVFTVNSECPAHCRKCDVQLVYIEPTTRRVVILQWELLLHNEFETIIMCQIPARYTPWLLYTTQLASSNVCKESSCTVNIKTYDYSVHKPVHNILTLDRSSSSSIFAQYVFLWTTNSYNWYEAESVCTDMGMQLASISSEEEYQLVTGMLWGEDYKTESLREQRILTPCKLEYYLCVIYIGMLVKVTYTNVCQGLRNRC